MGIFDFLRPKREPGQHAKAYGKSFNVDDVTTSAELMEFLRSGSQTQTGQSVTLNDSLQVAAVYRSAQIIAAVIGAMPIDIKNERTLEVQDSHNVRRLLNRRPNQWQTAHEFKKLLMNWVLFRGDGFARKVMVGNRTTALLPISPSAMKVEQSPTGAIVYTYTDKRGRETIFQQRDILHIRGMSLDGVRGVGVLKYAREAIGMSRSSQKHGARLFENGTKIGGALQHPGSLSDEAFNRLKASLEDFEVDGERFGKDVILEEGMEYAAVGMTSADAEFIENRKFSVQEIAMFFGVPPHMLGFTEKSTSWGSGIEQQSIGFVNYTLNDWFEAWEGAIERDLLADDPDLIADFNTYTLLRGDEKGRWAANQIKLQMGALNADEVRRDEGLPAKPNGEGQAFYSPPNVAANGETDDPEDPS